tara:strand:- start:1284 stop:1976 length:693 start_codon:yes stop_codon:yes gene_type:complete
MNVCIIPARGGSKRIPRKNIKLFHGKPMIAWSIEAAIKSECFDRIICSTDDEEIADVAKKYGAEIPFLRPKILSNDIIGTGPVVAHAIEYLKTSGEKVDLVCCVYATAPFILAEYLQESLQQIKNTNIDYCFSVTSYPYPIQRSIRITKEYRCEMFQPEMRNIRSQDLEDAYHDAGQFYWGKLDAWAKGSNVFSNKSMPYVLPRHRVQDIDTMQDWKMAELMFTNKDNVL